LSRRACSGIDIDDSELVVEVREGDDRLAVGGEAGGE
jgi:hypothetical protein